MEHLFGKEWDWAHSEAEQSNVRDARYHFQQYQLHQERVEQTARSKRSGRLNLQPLPDQLTIYYVAEMLRHACLAHMHRAVAGQVYRLDLLNTILEAAGQEEMLRVPAVALYYHAYQMLQSPDEPEPFERLKSALVEHEARFAAEEMRGLYLMAINGCIRRMNAGQRQYIREAFDLYRAALQRDFLTENGFYRVSLTKTSSAQASHSASTPGRKIFSNNSAPASTPASATTSIAITLLFCASASKTTPALCLCSSKWTLKTRSTTSTPGACCCAVTSK